MSELSERAWSFIREIPGSVFATVRQRVARHLLDLASEGGPDHVGAELMVAVSQQELADAVGTVREVVVRVRSPERAARQRHGQRPWARLNARLNASSES